MALPISFAAAALQWQSIDDSVMGGVSASRVSRSAAGTLVFSGKVSLENNGGFASIRSMPAVVDFSSHDGIVLRVRGDGKRYLLNLRAGNSPEGVQYRAPFATSAGQWIETVLPFAGFEPRWRGRLVADAPALDRGLILTFGLMVSDRQSGDFMLEIDTIAGFSGAAS